MGSQKSCCPFFNNRSEATLQNIVSVETDNILCRENCNSSLVNTVFHLGRSGLSLALEENYGCGTAGDSHPLSSLHWKFYKISSE